MGTLLTPFPLGKFKMPENSSKGNVAFKNKRLDIKFTLGERSRRIQCEFKKFNGDKDLKCDLL